MIASFKNTKFFLQANKSNEESSNTRVTSNKALAFGSTHVVTYPTPSNLSYEWSFGAIAGILLVSQILTGLFLAMHYLPHVDFAFASVEHISRDVAYGWFIRYLHANGASMFFFVVYIHIFRGIYYASYIPPRHILWCTGILIFVLMMATAFLGYVLPWGQMSFWGATVITNLFSAIPIYGDTIVQWLWGGFSVDQATLNRFYAFHFAAPFIIAGAVIAHIGILHWEGSGDPLGLNAGKVAPITFHPHFTYKDIFSLLFFFILFLTITYYSPNKLGHPDNYIIAESLSTPAHIVPEWYFLPFYAILRSIPDKLGGVGAMFGAILCLLALPWLQLDDNVLPTNMRPYFGFIYWPFAFNFLLLGWIGQQPAVSPYIEIGATATGFYFLFFKFLVPLIGYCEYRALNQKL